MSALNCGAQYRESGCCCRVVLDPSLAERVAPGLEVFSEYLVLSISQGNGIRKLVLCHDLNGIGGTTCPGEVP